MKNIRIQTALLLLLTAFAAPAFAQEEAKQEKSPLTDVYLMVKEVLGDYYVQTGHIESSDWEKMEPAAIEFVTILFESRKMVNGAEATLRVAEAKARFEAAIEALLTEEQKANRALWLSKENTWSQQKREYSISPAAMDAVRQQMQVNDGVAIISSDETLFNSPKK